MKAAIIHALGDVPAYEDFPDPIPQNGQEKLVRVTAASIKNLDKYRASGNHYDAHKTLPAVVGIDGVGVLENGARVYASGLPGMLAEKALVTEGRYCLLPDHVDDVTAAALPNPGLSAWFSLEYRARVQPGDTVFILGATGITGKLAIQLAKYFGAGKVMAAGRNPKTLESLYALGADETISLNQDDDSLKKALQYLHASTPFDAVIDYTWGHPTEVLLDALSGGSLHTAGHRTRYVTVGEMAGPTIQLKS
ncbi:MAG TPA: zinc-binding alcohol dehydrogenase family protein, partial [Chitinophaga sp.]